MKTSLRYNYTKIKVGTHKISSTFKTTPNVGDKIKLDINLFIPNRSEKKVETMVIKDIIHDFLDDELIIDLEIYESSGFSKEEILKYKSSFVKEGGNLLSLKECELELIKLALQKYTSVNKAGKAIGVSARTIHRKMNEYNLSVHELRHN